jgi:hypothetical protein
MHRVDPEVVKELHSKLIYTPEQISRLLNIKAVRFGIFTFNLDAESVEIYTTIDGISKQLDNFSERCGLVYYWGFSSDGIPDMYKLAVKILD